jgi:NAD(P)-dependent dehydrogenase (short-subunit alcohol dehydrogenase family)
MSKHLDGRSYIVTGGSRGFGLAIAESLIQEGARVGLIGRNAKSLDDAVAMLGANHAYSVAMDVSSREDIVTAFEQIKGHFGGLDGLVNNAGVARPGVMGELIEEEVAQQLNTNFMGTVFACQAVVPLIEDSDNPRIVNISSASAEHHDEMAHLSIYAASKAAVERFSRDLRRELQGKGIGVTILRPGAAMTEFAAGWDANRLQRALRAWHEHGPGMDTGMQPFHVGDAVAYCLRCPAGVSVDLLEIRPNNRVPKVQL